MVIFIEEVWPLFFYFFFFFLWAAVPFFFFFFFLLPPLVVPLPLCVCSFGCRDKHNNGFQRHLGGRNFSMTTAARHGSESHLRWMSCVLNNVSFQACFLGAASYSRNCKALITPFTVWQYGSKTFFSISIWHTVSGRFLCTFQELYMSISIFFFCYFVLCPGIQGQIFYNNL